jgi:hypothetical protein
MAVMRALVAILAGLGTIVGVVVGVVAHHRASMQEGWTLYVGSPRQFVDYLPSSTPWFPGILEYAALGLGAGIVIALALIVLRFRLVRVKPVE